MESKPSRTSISHHIHAHHLAAECSECPPKTGSSLNQKADCRSWMKVQALKEGSFSLDAPSGVPQFDAADAPGYAIELAYDSEHSSVLDTSPGIRSSNAASVPLRI
jgi:hypothetical protein